MEGDSACTATTRYHLRDFYPRPPGGGRLRAHTAIRSRPPISIHALRVEGDPDTDGDGFPDQYFYPRPPGGGRHQYRVRCNPERKISIHALRVEGDCCRNNLGVLARYFYPRPPGGGRRFIYADTDSLHLDISIHALRVEGDGRHPLTRLRDRRHFYPRPPGGGRPRVRLSLRRRSTFLSTPSGWRATGLVVLIPAHAVDFYPRPPGGGRPPLFSHSPCNTPISIHALRVEGDSLLRRFSKAVLQFLSTPSGWRATARAQRFGRIFCISIHALRVEGDNVLHIGLFGC